MGRLLVIPNSTRWNSTYNAWKVAAKEASKLNDLMDVIGELHFSNNELEYIAEFVGSKTYICVHYLFFIFTLSIFYSKTEVSITNT